MPDSHFCAACGHALSSSELSCPSCKQLTHAAELEKLVQDARAKQTAGQLGPAREVWSQALTLLPPESTQAAVVRERVETLGRAVHTPGLPLTSSGTIQEKPRPEWIKKMGPFAGVGVVIWKFFSVILLVLSKAKFLFLGLGQLKTVFSMLLSMGVYWGLYGWPFAVGFILGIYVHEMGHVWALKRFGLRASAPMFIPLMGALVSLYDSPRDVHEDARIGLAGPMWGAGAAAFFTLVALMPNTPGGGIWLALAHATAYINLFNLTPIWQLDGGRALRALDYKQRLSLGALFLVLWFVTGQGLFLILTLGAAYRIFWAKDHSLEGDQTVFFQFAGLAAAFGALMAAVPVR